MNLSFYISRRYLFAKRPVNAVALIVFSMLSPWFLLMTVVGHFLFKWPYRRMAGWYLGIAGLFLTGTVTARLIGWDLSLIYSVIGISAVLASVVAWLLSRESLNAINIISAIAIIGMAIGTAALVLVLSVFNGFEDLITGLFGNFNPDVKVIPAKGKTFQVDTLQLEKLRSIKGVQYASVTLEEVAFFEYDGSQDFGTVKGVDVYFNKINGIDSTIREGFYKLKDGDRYMAVLGGGMRNKLSVNIENLFTPISVYMPKRGKVGILEQPFKKQYIYPAGTFIIQQEFDNQYVLTDLSFAEELLDAYGEASAYEIRLNPAYPARATLDAIRAQMGNKFVVKDRYQQDEAFLKLMNIEKWMSFAILSLTLILVAFNMIGCLWMIVLEKKPDIAILKSMGAGNPMIRNIFLQEGLLLCAIGMLIGFFIAIGLYIAQKQFGIVPIPVGFVVDAYPISMRAPDFGIVGVTVIAIGLIASIPPALRAVRVSAMIREE